MSGADRSSRLIAVILDPASIAPAAPDVEHERAVAIYDLIEGSRFALKGRDGPYRLLLSLSDRRLVFDIRSDDDKPLMTHALSLTPFRRVVKDYFLISDSYRRAIRSAPANRIEAIDMGRRGVHNEGAEILMARLKGKVELDLDTARRLFTLICVLQWRG